MGNLYTKYKTKHDVSIELKENLRNEFAKNPRDYKEISRLQKELYLVLNGKNRKKLTPQQKYGMFGWKVIQTKKDDR